MAPIHNYTNWNKRGNDRIEQQEPYRKFFFICEGANTETWYFQKIVDMRKQLGIHPLIDVCLLEKTGKDRDISYPKHLIEFADRQKSEESLHFDRKHDKMIVVFDVDIFESKVGNYREILDMAASNNDILAVTNPAFELFLLLHYEGAYEELIVPNREKILQNERVGNHMFIYDLLLKKSGINSKKNPQIGDLAEYYMVAIEQERRLNQKADDALGQLTSCIGKVLEDIRNCSVPIS